MSGEGRRDQKGHSAGEERSSSCSWVTVFHGSSAPECFEGRNPLSKSAALVLRRPSGLLPGSRTGRSV